MSAAWNKADDRAPIDAVAVALRDPERVAGLLGLEGVRRGGGFWARCPVHADSRPSLSLRPARDHRGITARCFGCPFKGDVFGLIAAVDGLTLPQDFGQALLRARELAGIHAEAYVRPVRLPPPLPPPEYPPEGEVAAVWRRAAPAHRDPAAAAWLRSRGLDPFLLGDVARGVPAWLPLWACFQRQPWSASGHRLLLGLYDAAGALCSLRARLVAGVGIPSMADVAKSVAPVGKTSKELVLADTLGRHLLAAGPVAGWMAGVVICEGEPDFLTWAARAALAAQPFAVLGIPGSGSWSADVARRIPDGARVAIRVHPDRAGDAYAETLLGDLRHCRVAVLDAPGRVRRLFCRELDPATRRPRCLRRCERCAGSADDNDRAQRGELPVDPFADCEEVTP